MRQGQQSVGHPIDVASGTMYLTRRDFTLPGLFDLDWVPFYSTALLELPPSPLGRGWTSPFFATLGVQGDVATFTNGSGATATFDGLAKVRKGERSLDPGAFTDLSLDKGKFIVTVLNVDAATADQYVFNELTEGTAPVLALQDLAGAAIDVDRDRHGRPTALRQRAEKRSLALTYNAAGLVQSIALLMPGGSLQTLAEYEYDPRDFLVNARDALGHVEAYFYQEDGRMIRHAARDGGVFSFQYDAKGRCIRTSGQERYDEKTLRYFEGLGWTEVTDSVGAVWRYQWNALGQVVKAIGPLGRTMSTEYDQHGRIIARVSGGGAATKYEYDEAGNRIRVIDPVGGTFEHEFDPRHLPVKVIDPCGNVTVQRYDGQNRLVAVTDPSGGEWRFDYSAQGFPIRATNSLGAMTQQEFTVTGGLLKETDWEGNVTRFTTDHLGRVTERIDPLGHTWRFDYDLRGRQTGVTFPNNAWRRWTHDAGGNVTAIKDSDGTEIRFRYSHCGRLVERVDADGRKVQFVWGTEPGRLLRVINEKGETYAYTYDNEGRLSAEIGFDGSVRKSVLNGDGYCIAVVLSDDEKIEHGRDLAGKLVSCKLPDGTAYTYTYDPCGSLIGASSPTGQVTFERDVLGRVVKETQNGVVVETAYDRTGNVIGKKSSLGHTAQYTFDRNGQWIGLSAGPGHQIEIGRNARSEEIQRRWLLGVKLDQTFDPQGNLLAQKPIHGGGFTGNTAGARQQTITGRGYNYTPLGTLTARNDERWGDEQFNITRGGDLTAVVGATRESFTYDPAGNLTRKVGPGGDLQLDYELGGRLVRANASKFVYDPRGRPIQRIDVDPSGREQTWQFTWDALDQLLSVRQPDGAMWTYTYDALARRIGRKGPGTEVRYIWDQDVILHEVHADAKPDASWIFAPNTFIPVCARQNGQVFDIITDHEGTPREALDRHGQVVWSAALEAWGTRRAQYPETPTLDCPIRFQGQWHDPETGFHYNRYRYYDPATARYLTPDPMRLRGGVNLYRYVPNPLQWVDPFGLVNIGTGNEGAVTVNAYAGPDAGGIEHAPLHVHMKEGKANTRVLMEDYYKKGKLVGRAGDVYPGDKPMTKNMKNAIKNNLAHYQKQTNCVFKTGAMCP